MIDEKILKQLVERIVAATKPSRVIVFGSYGRDNADEDSDLDIMVIRPEVTDKAAEMVRLHEVVGDVGTGVVLPEARRLDRAQRLGSGAVLRKPK